MTLDDLPAGYPFAPDDKAYPGVLDGTQRMIHTNARDYARAGLSRQDFDEYDENSAGRLHINDELDNLRSIVTAAAETLETPGPWHGIDPVADVPLAAAELHALMSKLATPVGCLQEALTDAYNAALDRDPNRRKERQAWHDFQDRVTEAAREAGGDHLPIELRLAHLDHLIADTQRQKADLQKQHHIDTWHAERSTTDTA